MYGNEEFEKISFEDIISYVKNHGPEDEEEKDQEEAKKQEEEIIESADKIAAK